MTTFPFCQNSPGCSRISRAGLVLLLLAGCTLPGCKKSLAPASATARQAIESALNAWKDGKPVGRLEGTTPAIQVEDRDWFSGKKLADFEILSEEPKEAGSPTFSVRLHLTNPEATKDVRYLVHKATDCLWVRREDDYKRSMNWEPYENESTKPAESGGR